MTIKIEPKPAKGAADALGQHANAMYATLGKRLLGIVEFEAVERNEVADDDDKDTWVKLRIVGLEVPGADQEEPVRAAMAALNTQRTAYGTLTEDEDVELSQSTIERCAGDLTMAEAARLHVAIETYGDKMAAAARNNKLTAADLRRTITDLSRGLLGTVYPNMLPVTINTSD